MLHLNANRPGLSTENAEKAAQELILKLKSLARNTQNEDQDNQWIDFLCSRIESNKSDINGITALLSEAYKRYIKESKFGDLYWNIAKPYVDKTRPILASPPYRWGVIGDYYTGNPDMESKKDQVESVKERLGSKALKKLFKGATPPHEESTHARQAFMDFYAKKLAEERAKLDPNELKKIERMEHLKQLIQMCVKDIQENKEKNNSVSVESIEGMKAAYERELELHQRNKPARKMRDILGEEGLKLYRAAVKEEGKSRAFREAVFMRATTHYDGLPYDKPNDFIITGASGTGKSYSTKLLIEIKAVEELCAKLEGSQSSILAQLTNFADDEKDKIAQKFAEALEKVQEAKTVADAFKILDDQVPELRDLEFIKDLKAEVKKGNDVVAIDGGVDREMSQMRQIMLQGELSLGYEGISDLQSKKNSKGLSIKSKVGKAAKAANGPPKFSTAKPITLTDQPYQRFKSLEYCERFASEASRIARQIFNLNREPNRQDVVAFVEADAEQTEVNGINRAYRTDPTPYDDKNIKMNNMKIGCESKIYRALYALGYNTFKAGSEASFAFFNKAVKTGVPCYYINNKVVHLRKLPKMDGTRPEHWEKCTGQNPKFDVKVNLEDYKAWRLYVQEQVIFDKQPLALDAWKAKMAQEGKLQGVVITKKTEPMLESERKLDETRTLFQQSKDSQHRRSLNLPPIRSPSMSTPQTVDTSLNGIQHSKIERTDENKQQSFNPMFDSVRSKPKDVEEEPKRTYRQDYTPRRHSF